MSKESSQKKTLFGRPGQDESDAPATPPGGQAGLPLFFTAPAPLDVARHAKAGILPIQNLSFASKTNSIPLNVIEFTEAAKHYPIVFSNDENCVALAIVGLERENYFVGMDSRWKEGAYLPAYVRKYPFVFMDLPERQQFLLCIDEGAPQYKEKGGEGVLPFYNNEQPSDLVRNALEFCTAFQNHFQLSRQFCDALKAADILSPTQSDAKLYNGREIHLGGFQVVDEKKFNDLPDSKILELRKAGWLPYIYFALMSSSNWTKLIDMAAERERTKAN